MRLAYIMLREIPAAEPLGATGRATNTGYIVLEDLLIKASPDHQNMNATHIERFHGVY
jgi:hypothetical protein